MASGWSVWWSAGSNAGDDDLLDKDPVLTEALTRLAPSGILTNHRIISRQDADALLGAERAALSMRGAGVRRQSGAARIAARELLRRYGFETVAIPRSETGAPVWPRGVVGSLAHDDRIAVAAIARSGEFSALGIDIEPADPLPPELVKIVATPAECRRYPDAVLQGRLLFAAKEAIYKALHPLDGVFLEFQDIDVDLDAGRGLTRTGQSLNIVFTSSPCVVVLSFRLMARSSGYRPRKILR